MLKIMATGFGISFALSVANGNPALALNGIILTTLFAVGYQVIRDLFSDD